MQVYCSIRLRSPVHGHANICRARHSAQLGRDPILDLLLLMQGHRWDLRQVELQVHAVAIDSKKLWPDLVDCDFPVEQDFHLLVEIFDALRHDHLADHGLNLQALLYVLQHHELLRQLALLVLQVLKLILTATEHRLGNDGVGIGRALVLVILDAPLALLGVKVHIDPAIAEIERNECMAASLLAWHLWVTLLFLGASIRHFV